MGKSEQGEGRGGVAKEFNFKRNHIFQNYLETYLTVLTSKHKACKTGSRYV